MPTYVALRATNKGASVRVPGVTSVAAPAGLTATAVGSGGTFAAATYYWKVTAVGTYGETVGSNEASAAIVLNGSANLSWTAATGAVSYKVYRGTVAATENVLVGTATGTTFTDTGAAGTAATPPGTGNANTNSWKVLKTTDDVVVNVDDPMTRFRLNHHASIGQWAVSAVNTSTATSGALPANS